MCKENRVYHFGFVTIGYDACCKTPAVDKKNALCYNFNIFEHLFGDDYCEVCNRD